MAPIIGASCNPQPGPSENVWVHLSIFRQNSTVTRGVLKNGDLALKRHGIKHILSPRAPMTLTIGAPCHQKNTLVK